MNKLIIALFALAVVAQAGPAIQSGRFQRTYWSTGHIFEKDASTTRTENFVAKFATPFDQIPRIVVGLQGFDLGFNNAGIEVKVVRVARDGYDVQITCPKDSLCYQVTATFVAFVEGGDFDVITLTQADFSETQRNTWLNGNGERFVTKQLTGAVQGDNGAFTFMSGFSFNAGANVRFYNQIESAGNGQATVKLGTWADTKLETFRIQVFFFAKKEGRGAFRLATDVTGSIYNGSGVRNDVKSQEGVSVCGSTIFNALNHIDFINGRNYRIVTKLTHGNNHVSVTWTVWADTAVWQAKSVTFYSN